ncbi:unnamed protein product [Symbiodinium sp. CCMP2592]|nr:unnamed protein product [Symbiodinium sp. CCMP2592]
MCKLFPDTFVEWNAWADAENYLLVERLSSSSTSEEWQEVVEMMDEGETFELESVRLKARRKYAASHQLSLEDVSLEDVVASPHGLQGWAEMVISVPGIEQVDDGASQAGTTVSTMATPQSKRKREDSPTTDEKPPGKSKSGKNGGHKPKPKAKSCAASKNNKAQEKKAKELLCLYERGQQIVDRVVGEADRFPSEWSWCKPLLEEYRSKQDEFQKSLHPSGAEDLTEFINEFRLTLISPTALKDLKKAQKDHYYRLLTVFIDRCNSICEQSHGRIRRTRVEANHIASKIDNMAKAMSAASAMPATPQTAKKKRRASADEPEQPLLPQQTRAGENLRACLLDRFTMGSITGADVAELSFHITEAGGRGVSDLALRPEVAKSHGHQHVRRNAGKFYPEPDVTYINTPLFMKRETRRVNERVPMMLPSKLFELFVEKPEVLSKSEKRYEFFNGLSCFEQHPVVSQARSQGIPVRPIALYWDGVRYSVHDSFTGFFVTDLLSEQKFLSFLLSGLDMCQCGCRGWCSLYPALLEWTRDLQKLAARDTVRYAVLDIQTDWPAWLEVVGARFWSHGKFPCPLCMINQEQLCQPHAEGVTVVSMPYELFTHDTYEVTLREFTKVVPIPDAETMRTITRHLEYKKATLGRALVCDLPQLGLRKGWRLEPCPGLPDVGQFEFTPLPFDCTFWVGPEDGRLTHGCPLFDIPGLTWESWAIDIMHSWHLGPLQQLVSLTLHFCIGSGLFAPKTIHLNASDRQQMSLLVIKSELFLFYQQLRELDPEWKRKGTEAGMGYYVGRPNY